MAIAHNRMADAARRYARQGANATSRQTESVTFSDESKNIHEGVYGDPEALRQAIQDLPRAQREAIEMLKRARCP